MAIYKLSNGYRVRTKHLDGERTEFVTMNAEREVISTVVESGDAAAVMLRDLCIADAWRFAQTYGGQVR